MAGSYAFDLTSANPEDVQDIVESNGEVLQLQDGRRVLIPHGHAYVINGDQVDLAKSYLPTLIGSAAIENAVVLEWRNDGSFKIVRNVEEIELAVNPDKDRYNPDARIDPAGVSAIARRRFYD